jgi:pimeloyl-ACP methyl ester carboxylesterase
MAHSLARCDEMYLLSRGSGETILFLHGIPTSCRLWDGVIERMFGQFTCMAVDLPGLGRTAEAAQGFRQLEALAAKIEDLRIKCKVEKWHLVGHDAGCAIAVHYAHQFPDQVGRLALLTPSIFPELRPFSLFEMLRKRFLGEAMAPAINLLFWELVMRRVAEGNKDLIEMVKDFRAPFAGFRGAWRLMSLLRWGNPIDVLGSVPALLPQLLMPTLIVHGATDPAVPTVFATRASKLIPHSEMVLLDAGHFLPMNEPGRIADELLRFFGIHGDLLSKWDEVAVATD